MADNQGPSPEDIRRQEELNNLKRENISYTEEQTRKNRENADISNGLIDDLKEALGIRQRYTQNEASLLKLNKDINSSIDRQKVGLSSVKEVSNQIKKNEDLINKAKATANSLTKGLSKEQADLVKDIKEQRTALNESNIEYENLIASAQEGAVIDENRLNELKEKIALQEEEVAAGVEMLSTQASLVLVTEQQIEQLEGANKLREEELSKLEKIKKSFGFTGKVAKALGELPVIGSAFTKALGGAEDRVKKIVEETGKVPSRLKRASIFAEEFSGIAAKASLGFIMKQALALNSSFVAIGRTLGVSKSEIRDINQELRDTEAASDNIYTTDTERLATLNKISQTLGMNAQILGSENVAGAARLEQSLGLAAEDAQALALNAGIAGENVMDVTKEVINTTNEFNNGNKTLYNSKAVLQDVAKVSTNLKTIYGFNTKELTKSVLEAKKLGLTLDEVAGIGKNLLDFESSIQAELEAELLTGKQLNLEKARQAALSNDLKTLGEEISKQGLTMAEYSSLGAIGQEKMAAAMGMTQEQLAKAVQQEELRRLGKEKFAELHGNETLEAMEQLKVQEKLEKSLARMAEAVTPIAEGMADLLSNTTALSTILGIIVVGQLTKFVARLSTITGLNLLNLSLTKKQKKESQKEAAADAVSAGAEAAKSVAAIPMVGGFLAVGLAAGVIGYLMGQLNKADDLKSMGGYGKRTLLAPDGAFALNDNDNIIATTNDLPEGGLNKPPKTQTIPVEKPAPVSGGASVDMGPVVAALNELIATVKAGGTIEIDGQAVGRAVTLVDYQTGGG